MGNSCGVEYGLENLDDLLSGGAVVYGVNCPAGFGAVLEAELVGLVGFGAVDGVGGGLELLVDGEALGLEGGLDTKNFHGDAVVLGTTGGMCHGNQPRLK